MTYKVDGEISGETESYEYGADVTLREEPVKEGYTFSHWSRTTGFTMPAENVVIEGSFKINSYIVTYKGLMVKLLEKWRLTSMVQRLN